MAQKLKDETRTKIIEAAKKEFLEKGYEDASMRNIAASAGITVGNIYRYFENKEELSKVILGETNDDITVLLNSLKVTKISKEPRVFEMRFDPDQISAMMEKLSIGLCDLYFEKKSEFGILLNDSSASKKLIEWFEHTIRDLLGQTYSMMDQSEMRDLLSHAFAISIYEGLKDIFRNEFEDRENLIVVVRAYLNSFMRMVSDEYDLRKLY